MKKLALTLTLLAGMPLAALAQVSKEDIRKLSSAGISDDVILSYMRANGPVAKLTAEDVIDLKAAGTSEKVLAAALGNAPAATPSYTAPAETRIVEKPYYLPPSTTYVYDSAPVVYTSAYYGGYYPAYYGYGGACYPRYYGSYYPRYYGGHCAPYATPYYRSGVSVGVGYSSGYHNSGVRVGVGYSGGYTTAGASYSRGGVGVGGYIRR